MDGAIKAGDYRSRLKNFEGVEAQRRELIEDVLSKLDVVTAELALVSKSRAKEVADLNNDLESERLARRVLQQEAAAFRQSLSDMKHGRFALVLIDADADVYMFRNELLAQGKKGGQSAANELMQKVRLHLGSLDAFKDAENIPIVVKAYANLHGLAQACVRDNKVSSVQTVVDFWCGFSRQFPCVDFVDVGAGKEEADNKLRGVLAHHIANPLCEQVFLACCHDAGYGPVLRQYATEAFSTRITLIASGPVREDLRALGLQTTKSFVVLFNATGVPTAPRSYAAVAFTTALPVSAVANGQLSSNSVQDSDRLKPVMVNDKGRRVDKPLNIHRDHINEIRKRNLCHRHFLHSDCKNVGCDRRHDDERSRRPLSQKNFDALWIISRENKCHNLAKKGKCEDDQCIYGHGF